MEQTHFRMQANVKHPVECDFKCDQNESESFLAIIHFKMHISNTNSKEIKCEVQFVKIQAAQIQ